MTTETVITLRRGLFGFRESRSLGGYCFTCKVGVPLESQRSAASQPGSFIVRSCRTAGALISRAGGLRSDILHTDPVRLSKPLPLVG